MTTRDKQNNITTLARRLRPFLLSQVANSPASTSQSLNKILLVPSGTGDVTPYAKSATGLTAAIAAAAAGDMIYIPSGTISGNHTIASGVEVIGWGKNIILSGTITNNGILTNVQVSGTLTNNSIARGVIDPNGDLIIYQDGGTGDGMTWDSTDDELRIVGLFETTAVSPSDIQYHRMKSSDGTLIAYIGEASQTNSGGVELRGYRTNDDGSGVLIRGVRAIGQTPDNSADANTAAILLEAAGSSTNAEGTMDALPADFRLVLIGRRDGTTGGADMTDVAYYSYGGDHYMLLGSYYTIEQFISTASEGMPPLDVTSSTWIKNLHADLLDGHHASDFILAAGLLILTIVGIRSSTSPDVYGTGIALGDIDATAGTELIAGFGSDLNVSPVAGTLRAFDVDGTELWSYNSPNNDYIIAVDAGDIDGDSDIEILVGTRLLDHSAILLDNAGTAVWTYDAGAGNYIRAVAIGEVDSTYANKEAVVAGANGFIALLEYDGTEIWQTTITTATVQGVVIADTDADAQNEIIIAVDTTIKKLDKTGSVTWTTTVGDAGGSYPYGVAVGNVTSATGLEIAASIADISAGGIDGVKLLDKDGNVLWTWNSSQGCWAVAIGDVTGDGNNEIVAGRGTHITASPPDLGTGGVTILDSTGAEIGSIDLPSSVKFVRIGDADNDGENEIVASCDDGNIYIIDVSTIVTDDRVKVSSNDTTGGYLNGKLVAGTGITLTEGNDGGDETLTIAATAASSDSALIYMPVTDGDIATPEIVYNGGVVVMNGGYE